MTRKLQLLKGTYVPVLCDIFLQSSTLVICDRFGTTIIKCGTNVVEYWKNVKIKSIIVQNIVQY